MVYKRTDNGRLATSGRLVSTPRRWVTAESCGRWSLTFVVGLELYVTVRNATCLPSTHISRGGVRGRCENLGGGVRWVEWGSWWGWMDRKQCWEHRLWIGKRMSDEWRGLDDVDVPETLTTWVSNVVALGEATGLVGRHRLLWHPTLLTTKASLDSNSISFIWLCVIADYLWLINDAGADRVRGWDLYKHSC